MRPRGPTTSTRKLFAGSPSWSNSTRNRNNAFALGLLRIQKPAELLLRLARHLGARRVGGRKLVAPGPRPAGVDDGDRMRHVAPGAFFRRQPRGGRRIPRAFDELDRFL